MLPDKEGNPYSVHHDAVNAMLLNERCKLKRLYRSAESVRCRLPHRVAQFKPARKTFIVHADEKLPALLEVESVVRASDPSW